MMPVLLLDAPYLLKQETEKAPPADPSKSYYLAHSPWH